MKLIIQSVERDFFGVFHLSILIDGKEYSFHISSEFALRQANLAMKKHRPGRALNILKQFNHKEIYNGECCLDNNSGVHNSGHNKAAADAKASEEDN